MPQCMRINSQPSHIFFFDPESVVSIACVSRTGDAKTRRPQRAAPERVFETFDRPHRDRVAHLLMELRIALRRGQAVHSEDVIMVEIHRGITATARRIDVDDFDIFADRSRLEPFFPPNVGEGGVDVGGVQRGRQ